MSDLRRVPAPPGRRAGRLGVGAPGYAHPMLAPVEWAELVRPDAPVHWAVLKVPVTGGAGARPDPYCLTAASRLRSAGVPLLGHLDFRRGSRPGAELLTEAGRFLDWYGVAGFYLDRAPAALAALPATATAVGALRSVAAEHGHPPLHVVLGTDAYPHPGYLDLVEQLVAFRGSWTDYRWSEAAAWTADHPPSRFCHLVHGVPRGHLEEALRIARWQGAGTVYVTDATDRPRRPILGVSSGSRSSGTDPFETLPGYWDDIISRTGTAISE
ncbi:MULTISPECIES: spherulation-specific family 4 protein [unclassified Streptomyces]|uniref:spherulation-specific family 4 protein n=1 Tax=unclassified Streptomyces TaxID=2593676 RepID=UPI0022B71AF0|nr:MULTISPECIES: spherulation-specific family 4 protein [unclassified Streptomyces]MCZ7416673.1 phage tail protein [Streptomyces sp. WMMC897]MCZ7433517.1 phage tail protein [Streptomyces sp. WMMC1477]